MSTRVILDCDPGIDDALAIAFAIGHPGIEFTGITTVAGNVGLAKTTANALAVASFAGAPGVPVTAGCPAANAIASASSMPGSQSRMIVVLMARILSVVALRKRRYRTDP